jgi:hypothetical protein
MKKCDCPEDVPFTGATHQRTDRGGIEWHFPRGFNAQDVDAETRVRNNSPAPATIIVRNTLEAIIRAGVLLPGTMVAMTAYAVPDGWSGTGDIECEYVAAETGERFKVTVSVYAKSLEDLEKE